jgi:hypothetical protein
MGASFADIVGALSSPLVLRATLAVVCVVLAPAVAVGSPGGGSVAQQRIFGVTVDDIGRLPAVLGSLRALPRRPWVRVVFDVDPNRPADPARYSRAVPEVARIGPVLGELVDSSDIRRLTVAQIEARASSYVRALRSSVSVWEIGNEVNGSWTGPPPFVARKVQTAYDTVRGLGGRTALTLYENEGCGDGPEELSPVRWSERYLAPQLRAGVAYVLLSYYEGQCRGLRPSPAEWTRRFASLRRLFPNAQVGFGEIGMPQPATRATRAAAASLIAYYYGLDMPLSYYVGGGFYWYFAEDMVPWRGSPLWGVLARSWSVNPASQLAARATTAEVSAPPSHVAFS